MPKIDETTKQQRLERLCLLLARHPRGAAEAEIADEIGLERRTVNNYLRELEDQGKVFKDGMYWFPLVLKESRLRPFDLSPEEAVTLYLGARLLAKQQDKRNEPAETALLKLASVLKADAGVGDEIEQAARELAGRPVQAGYQPIFRDMVRGYIYRKKVVITYRPLNWNKSFETTFSTYLLEPSPIGFSTYLIGHSSIVNALRAYKLERIESARLTRDDYAIPPDFPGLDILRNAWSIVTGEETVRVVLRFSPQVKARVLETRWHPSQETSDDLEKPGYLRWQVDVADTLDLLPWVRGWGSDCEVVGPEELRAALVKDVRKMGRLYQITETVESTPNYFSLWAKSEKSQDPDIHPLIYHLLDVGECTLALWQSALSTQTRQMFANWLHLDEECAGRQLTFWASLHDLGKASPGFQRKYPSYMPELAKRGFTFPGDASPHPAPHGIVSAWALKDLLITETGLDKADARAIAGALGGHHGSWPTNDKMDTPFLQASDKGDAAWDAARRDLFQAARVTYQPVNGIHLPKQDDERNAFLTLFSGLVSVADWVGSMTEYFPFEADYLPPAQYASQAKQKVMIALEKLGWIGWQAGGEPLSFTAMFPDISSPNEIQQTVFDAAERTDLPALVILEAPTGIGKTEAALYLADRWLQTRRGKGIYIAMPTQATSNQMYGRVIQFLTSRYPVQSLNAHLVHGAALLAESDATLQPQGIALDEKTLEGSVKAESWFLPRKRTLLAPFGVGTVDQALLSVLQTNHFFVRLFGLGQKVVVFDEIHAYDTYMSTLFQRLLRWLRSIGTSVILLSATLPAETRKKLVEAWLGDEEVTLPVVAYPRLTVAGPANVIALPLPTKETRTVQLTWIDPTPGQIADHLAEKLQGGGCAAVICNRVQRAQDVYAALKTSGVVETENLILFHARFPFLWRKEIEDRVLKLFSKTGQRPHKAIVVATQVIEQSLDLDFDYMITDLAPIDLLLQRAGRLHRHPQNQASRSSALQTPTLAIGTPEIQNGLPEFGLDKRIYDLSTLLSTWFTLQGRAALTLPQQTEGLIESVYGQSLDENLPEYIAKALQAAREKARQDFDKETYEARKRIIASPDYEDLLVARNEKLEEDDNKLNDAFRALTRLGDPTVSIICLHQTSLGIALDPDGNGAPLELSKRPNKEQARQLLLRAVSVQRRDVVNYVVTHDERKAEWKRSAMVRDHFPLEFDANGEYHPDGAGFILKLSRELGLQVFKQEAK
jgi:CRISPR-associated endonuclease/helicase Cas3